MRGISLQAGKTIMERNQTPRELALWDEAIVRLLKKGYIKKIGRKNLIYQVTAIGYDIAEGLKTDNEIDTSATPTEILKDFDN